MKKTTISTYKKDKYYESIKSAVNGILKKSNFVSPIDVLISAGNLTKDNYESWRFRKVPYLEKVIVCNLSALMRKIKIIKHYCSSIGLTQSRTVYNSWGKGAKILLRFSKTGNPHIEELYSTHYVTRKKDDTCSVES
jgi:hypothetical protein